MVKAYEHDKYANYLPLKIYYLMSKSFRRQLNGLYIKEVGGLCGLV
jgi:hypothetical protein